ncbi:MAG: pyridoxamine 5'-phosphate oxidase family protein [Myxococcota bacterium]
MSLAMTKADRDAFLADVHVGVIGIEQAGAPPLMAPIWYDYAPDAGLWVLTGPDSLKGRAIAAAGRFSLVAQVEEPPAYQYVSVEGPVVSTEPADLERDTRPMARRYFGTELGDLYVKSQASDTSVRITMRPETWRTVDYRKLTLA